MKTEKGIRSVHLTEDDLIALAVPSGATLDPLPAHLSECLECSRALAAWKSALREIGAADEEALAHRSSEEWRVAEEETLAKIRRAGAPGRSRARTLRWALALAASLLIFALLIGSRLSAPRIALDDTGDLSARDRADDALLRDVDRLAVGDDSASGWGALAPEPNSAPVAEQRS